ncbi:MAG: NADP-dependent malic enzyme [Candidatus Marinimicrobia bacterium]|nr:NADP-dependent malic enzyme [Candidatus Neomarinimicrobiota bacterium]
MKEVSIRLNNLDEVFSDYFTEEKIAEAKTIFLKKLSETAHEFYGGKIQTAPKAGVFGFNWFNVWYTPGVSKVSTTVRDDNDRSFDLLNRGNIVAVVSDSTRVLGDGNCTPPGGLGVMEGKAFLMKYLGGVDAVPLCIDSRNEKGENDPQKIIDFVKMVQYSFGAINLEDISQPNCYKVLDTLREECEIPVWHDDAQGTACVTLAGLINALKLANKKISDVKIAMLGAGASNSTIARLIMTAGGNPKNIIMFDSKGGLHKNREDIKSDPRFYRKWEICQSTNPENVDDFSEACKGADVLIALSTPGPDTVKPEWISSMADKSIVFTCANPVPEIYPYAAKEAGAYIVATGRGDFSNQVNNSIGFPGILKGALLVRAKKVTDNMAITAAYSLAQYAEDRGIDQENIVPTMEEYGVFQYVAAEVAMQAIKDGVARKKMTKEEVRKKAGRDIVYSRTMTKTLMDEGYIEKPPQKMLQDTLEFTLKEMK